MSRILRAERQKFNVEEEVSICLHEVSVLNAEILLLHSFGNDKNGSLVLGTDIYTLAWEQTFDVGLIFLSDRKF